MAITISVVLFAIYIIISPSPSKVMKSLDLGSSYNDVIKIAGSPSYETDGSRWVEPQYTKTKSQMVEGCIKELWYEAWPSFIPEKYAFCFDSNNILVGKVFWKSW